jgi:hypothetical protein
VFGSSLAYECRQNGLGRRYAHSEVGALDAIDAAFAHSPASPQGLERKPSLTRQVPHPELG